MKPGLYLAYRQGRQLSPPRELDSLAFTYCLTAGLPSVTVRIVHVVGIAPRTWSEWR